MYSPIFPGREKPGYEVTRALYIPVTSRNFAGRKFRN